MLFKKEYLQEVVFGENDHKIEEEIVGTSRWSVDYNMIFKNNEKFYGVYFSRGATEYQSESPFDYDFDEIECVEVKKVKKVVEVWEEVVE